MTRNELVRTYRKLRATGGGIVGENALGCWRDAKIIARFGRLADLEMVRIAADDERDSYFDVFGEPDDERERAAIIESIERNGNYVVYTEYRCGCCGNWKHADSIGQCAGYNDPTDPAENCYVPDMMAAAIDAYRDARKLHKHRRAAFVG